MFIYDGDIDYIKKILFRYDRILCSRDNVVYKNEYIDGMYGMFQYWSDGIVKDTGKHSDFIFADMVHLDIAKHTIIYRRSGNHKLGDLNRERFLYYNKI